MSLSQFHEALIDLFRFRPQLAAEVLRDHLRVNIPAFSDVTIGEADFTSPPIERRADLVVLLHEGRPVLVIVVEVQLAVKQNKLRIWPVFAAHASLRHDCDAIVLVVTPDDAVARWARQPMGPDSRRPFYVEVLGPEAVPIVTDPANAKSNPELAVLSAVAHGNDPEAGPSVAVAAMRALSSSPEAQATVYLDLVLSRLSDAVRTAVEELMASGNYEYQSDFAKKYYGQGKAEGKAEGEAKGKAEGEARAILTVLDVRGIAVTDAQRARVLSTLDLSVLNTWLTRAATCASAAEVFTD